MAGTTALKPADQVEVGPYDLVPLRAPIVGGWPLRIFINLLESSLGTLALPKLLRDAGFPQVLREIELPERPTFFPVWPPPEKGLLAAEISFPQPGAAERARAAADIVTDIDRRSPSPSSAGSRAWTVSDFQAAYMSGATTPAHVAENVLKAIAASEAHDPPLKLFAAYDAAHLRQQAKDSAQRYGNAAPRSILEGVPFAVKDLTDALPYPTASGNAYMAEWRTVTEDAPIVAALKAAGAMLVGKSATVEFGINPLGYNAFAGTPRNPHDTSRLTGGSSSGTAGLVAAGICPISTGTDGGGSIRVPSSFSGVTGLFPTQGRRSHKQSKSDDTISNAGPMGSCIADVALAYVVSSNAGTEDNFPQPPAPTLPLNLTPSQGDQTLSGVRIGVFKPYFNDAEGPVVDACNAALRHVEASGAVIVDIVLPELNMARLAHAATILSEFGQSHKAEMRAGLRSRLNYETRVNLSFGEAFLATDYLQAQRIRTRLMTHLRRAFRECDVMATPTTPMTAPLINEIGTTVGVTDTPLIGRTMKFVTPANLAGLPALSLPVGHDPKGMPIGLQLLGPAWSEARLLQIGAVVEAAMQAASANRLPAIHYDVLFGTGL